MSRKKRVHEMTESECLKNRSRRKAIRRKQKLSKEWRDNRRTRRRLNRRKLVRSLRFEIITNLGSRCNNCQIDDIDVLQIDHIHGFGGRERKKFKYSIDYYRHLLKIWKTINCSVQIAIGKNESETKNIFLLIIFMIKRGNPRYHI
jgi:hypothetical protein